MGLTNSFVRKHRFHCVYYLGHQGRGDWEDDLLVEIVGFNAVEADKVVATVCGLFYKDCSYKIWRVSLPRFLLLRVFGWGSVRVFKGGFR